MSRALRNVDDLDCKRGAGDGRRRRARDVESLGSFNEPLVDELVAGRRVRRVGTRGEREEERERREAKKSSLARGSWGGGKEPERKQG